MLYQEPKIVILEISDIIVTSVGGFHDPNNPNNDNVTGAGGDWIIKTN